MFARYAECTMDVVEIDEGTTELARKYFNLIDHSRLRIIHEDGRVFLNRNTKKYDAVIGDAFNSYTIPAQLVTVEATQLIYNSLNDGGVYIINVIGSLDGTCGAMGHAVYSTMQEVFPQVYMFPVWNPDVKDKPQNLILVGIKSQVAPLFASEDEQTNALLGHLRECISRFGAMTDEYAPVDRYSVNFMLLL
jgi:spermidine synthase